MNSNGQNRGIIVIGGIVALAVVAAVVFIAVSLSSGGAASSNVDYSAMPQTRLEDGGFVVGNPDAPITLIEFADYACPHCQDYEPTMTRFINEYVKSGKAKFEFRIFPTAGGQTTYFVGSILVCMEEQKAGAFWKAHGRLFHDAASGNYDGNTLRQIASEIGVDYGEALNCSQNQKQVDNDVELGRALGVEGTPAVRVRYANGEATTIPSFERGGPTFEQLTVLVAAASQQ
ncbi:MAG: thioredoxin domain-containing protein [Anaerolineae bacterium]